MAPEKIRMYSRISDQRILWPVKVLRTLPHVRPFLEAIVDKCMQVIITGDDKKGLTGLSLAQEVQRQLNGSGLAQEVQRQLTGLSLAQEVQRQLTGPGLAQEMASFTRQLLALLVTCWPLTGLGRQYRPRPDMESYSVLDLIESKSSRYDPSPSDLDIGRLTMKLGRFLDSEYMSIDMPNSLRRGVNVTWQLPFKVKKNGHLRTVGRIPASLRRLRLDQLTLPDGSRQPVRLTRRLRRKMLKYLHMYTHCAVRYRWKDLGVRFWPRWLRTGHCDTTRSCSIPAGMTCQPARSRHLTLLRWHCQDWRRSRHCKWLRVQYPVVSKCQCSCPRR
ncbi:noggin-2-like [Pollicipes pollicipes]|uniref:noggin-2-like n=1 Tax=Pollicipes pollicipes TaxID=41117 RepID=UPI001884FAC2|nr:noggin-2-like [Pollicipes pollicipes]